MSYMYETNIIVARSKDYVIGEKGSSKLLWKQKADMKFFKEMTTNKIVFMGNNTFKSMGSKPLPNRINVVLSSTAMIEQMNATFDSGVWEENISGSYLLYQNNISSINELKILFKKDLFIIGGETVYDLAIKELYIDNVYETVLDTELKDSCTNPAYFNAPFGYDREELYSGVADADNTYDYKIFKKSKK